MVLGFIFKSTIHLNEIVTYDVNDGLNVTFWHVDIQFFLHYLLNKLPFCILSKGTVHIHGQVRLYKHCLEITELI